MRLNTFTDYSLRVLLYLALTDNYSSTRHDVAAAFGISDNHLMKVVNFLGRNNYIITTRGKGGGIKLSKPPEDINVGHLVRLCESGSSLIECLAEDTSLSQCRLSGVCALQGALREGTNAFYETLSRYVLADVIKNKSVLRQRIGITAPLPTINTARLSSDRPEPA